MKLRNLAAVAMVATLVAGAAQAEPRRRTNIGSAYAPSRGGHRMAGCGLGSLVVDKGDKWSQVAASILNGTGVQTFGISFGTSNCTEDGVATAAREKDAFVEANFADLSRDVAAGSGEYLTSLSSFYGCQGQASVGFGSALQRHQEEILGASNIEAAKVIDEAVAKEKAACQG